MRLSEETLSSEVVYNGRIITVKKDTVMLENGQKAPRELINHPGGVCVVPLTDNGEVIMVRQFRYAYKKALLEVPAGKLNYGEDPFECGKRELMEETGAVAENYTYLGKVYPTPAYLDEVIHVYLAQGLSFGEQKLDEDEFLEVERYPLSDLVQMVMNNEIEDAKTQVAILKTHVLLNGK